MKAMRSILAAVIVVSLAQFMLKFGLIGSVFDTSDLFFSVVNLFLDPVVLLGLVALGVGAVIWLSALSKADLSYAVPMMSLGYVFITVASYVFLDESINFMRWAGIGVVGVGIFLMAGSDKK